MAKRAKITDAVFARGVKHIADDLNALCDVHKLQPADLIRGLLEATVAFYKEHGFFSFPIKIEPAAFQARWVAETQSTYQSGPAKGGPHPEKPPDKSKRRTGVGPTNRVSKSA